MTPKNLESLDKIEKIIEGIASNVLNFKDPDAQLEEMIFKQKRSLLQKFIDFDEKKGIRVKGLDKIKIYFSVESSL